MREVWTRAREGSGSYGAAASEEAAFDSCSVASSLNLGGRAATEPFFGVLVGGALVEMLTSPPPGSFSGDPQQTVLLQGRKAGVQKGNCALHSEVPTAAGVVKAGTIRIFVAQG